MARYNFFISYCRSDGLAYARQITELLTQKGYTVCIAEDSVPAGTDYSEVIAEAIKNSDCFLPVITDNYSSSQWATRELAFAFEVSSSRGQKVVPLVFSDKMSDRVMYYTAGLQNVQACEQDISAAVEQLDRIYGSKLKVSILYEKLVEFKNIKNYNKIADTVCELIALTLEKWNTAEPAFKTRQNICRELLRLYAELESYIGSYDEESKLAAHKMVAALNSVEALLNGASLSEGENVFLSNLYFSSVALRLIYSDRIIRMECADVITSGDVRSACAVPWYVSKQRSFLKAYTESLKNGAFYSNLSDEDTVFITETKEYIFENISDAEADSALLKEKTADDTSENDEILLSVARFMQEGNKLFDVLESRGIAGDFLSCLLTSYERLKNYCEIIGAKDVAADCVDRIVEIRRAIDKASGETIGDEKVENGIKSLLGFTIKSSGNYDVFISFKSEDSDLAERVYDYCQQNLKVPFWSKKTLPQLSKSEYEDAIYDAIRKSRHFVVVLSKLDYLSANWIKREMSAFDRAITEGRKQDANFVFVVTDDVYKKIIDSNKMCLDERYCGYQIIKMSNFEETLISYIV